jgi:hypothetical protein
MEPLSLTTLHKSLNMAVLFQPSSIVLKPNPPSVYIGPADRMDLLGRFGGLTKRNPECSMKWIERSSPEA